MKNLNTLTVLCCVLLLSSLSSWAYDQNGEDAGEAKKWLTQWQEEDSKDGVRAMCRKHVSKILQCRFTTIVDEPAEALTQVILDVERFKEWAVSVMESKRVVYDEGDTDIYVYTTYDFTGAYDRDALTRYRYETSMQGRRHRISFVTVDKPYEAADLRLVRFPLMAGYWQFTRLDNGQTQLEHQSFTLPGGVVQSTLYGLFNVAYLDSSFATIKALRKQARKPEYLKLTKPSAVKTSPQMSTHSSARVEIDTVQR